MGDKSKIEWTDATPMIDRNGCRVRYYHRKDLDRPGQQERRKYLLLGKKWCRGCLSWLPKEEVVNGACRCHTNEEYRKWYASGARVSIAARVHARKRSIEPLPTIAAEYLTEQFMGLCAYCDSGATTWDHIVPVSAGGKTEPGNIVPACLSCNSKKKDRPVDVMPTTGRLMDILILQEMF